MFQKIVEFYQKEFLSYWLTESGTIGVSFYIDTIDYEKHSLDYIENSLDTFLNSLSYNVICKIRMQSNMDLVKSDITARNLNKKQGFALKNRVRIDIHKKTSLLENIKKFIYRGSELNIDKEINSCLDLSCFENIGLKIYPVDRKDILGSFQTNTFIKNNFSHIDLGTKCIFSARMFKATSREISADLFAQARTSLDLPNEMFLNFKKIKREVSESFLKRKSRIAEDSEGKVGARKYIEAEEALEDVSLKGDSLVEYELILNIESVDEFTGKSMLESSINALKPVGDFKQETYGLMPTYASTLAGGDIHVPIKEKQSVFLSLIPIGGYGNGNVEDKINFTSMPIHRADDSIDYVDVFNSDYENYSCIIVGRSGSGKSVATNLLTEALLNDPKVEVIKVDVGGSHSKETKLLKGNEYKLSLNKPSGVNPFSYIKYNDNLQDVTNILTGFINVLLLEEGESFLSKEMRSKIEDEVGDYIKSSPKNPCLLDFYRFTKKLPRKDLLKRWVEGVYSNAFSEGNNYNNENRLNYYNFSEIFQANDPDFAQGGMAAIMAKFNLDMLFKKDKKLVFIADETPFFVNRCFNFFKFSTANVRKFGGSFITISQKLSDLVVNNDTGIIDNSNTKILFSVDGDEHSFQKHLKLTSSQIDKINSLVKSNRLYSEAVYIDNLYDRLIRFRLSSDEYWRFSSKKEDNEKISKLLDTVPNLSLEEALQCLSV